MGGTCFSYSASGANREIYQEEKRKSRNWFLPLKPYITSTASSILLQLHFTMNKYLGAGNSPTPPTSYSTAELPSMFSSFFSPKIQNVRNSRAVPSFHRNTALLLSSCLWNRSIKHFEVNVFQTMWTWPDSCISVFYSYLLHLLPAITGIFALRFLSHNI